MTLAQGSEVAKIAGDAISKSSDFGFAALFLMVVFITAAAYAAAKFWFIEKPESNTRRETQEKNAESMQKIAVAISAISEQLDQHTKLHEDHSNNLSTIRKQLQQFQQELHARFRKSDVAAKGA